MFRSPVNNVIVQVDKKWVSGITDVLRQAQLNPGNQLNPADCVNIVGTIVSLPRAISNAIGYKGFSASELRVGDTAIFRYDVIFAFAEQKENQDPIHKNEIFYGGKSYWAADIQKIFGVIRNGEIVMVNGYCMIEEMSNPSGLILPQSLKKLMQAQTATISHIGNNLTHLPRLDVQPGDKVFFNPLIVQNYQIKGKKFGIISQKHIFGKKIPTYADMQLVN